jgi:hypothetical protein
MSTRSLLRRIDRAAPAAAVHFDFDPSECPGPPTAIRLTDLAGTQSLLADDAGVPCPLCGTVHVLEVEEKIVHSREEIPT